MVSEEQECEMELASEKIPVPPAEKTVEEPSKDEEPKPEVPRKKHRKRHKELHAAILKQMEFYFGDANLSKDRFLAKLISEDPWVDLSIFMAFNKIKMLTTEVSRIASALKESTMLEVSEDGTKIRRTTAIQQKENSEECTVYVQRLPPEADHDWISKLFSEYGAIDYISIPKYKNKAIKGFAFVEYKTADDARKCIQAFRAKGCVLPSQTSPNSLMSITTHEECDHDIAKESLLKKEKKEEEEVEGEAPSEECKSQQQQQQQLHQNGKTKKKKKRLSHEEAPAAEGSEDSKKSNKKKRHGGSGTESDRSDSLNNPPRVEKESRKGRKRKGNSESLNPDGNDEPSDASASAECEQKRRKKGNELPPPPPPSEAAEIPKKQRTGSEEELDDDSKAEEGKSSAEIVDKERTEKGESDCEVKVESKRKKKKRKRNRSTRKEEDHLEAPDTGLEIMAKREWKRLRNKYLEMQRAKMKQLKQHLKRATWNQWQNVEKIERTEKPEKVYSEKREEEEEEEEPRKKDDVKAVKSPRFSFAPGLIVKIEMESPCSDPKNFKTELKGSSSNSSVKYVDVSEGSNIAFVRCDSAESAKLLAQKATEERTMIILEGDEEKAYWDKMAQDREEKIGNNVRVKQRGRDKLLKRAEKELGKHIKFDQV